MDFRGDTILEEISENLMLNDIGLASQENISCSAVNEIGFGESDTVQLEVFGNWLLSTFTFIDSVISVPPNFIENLPEEGSFLSNDENLSLMCQVKN